jgi:hypothetical protein
MVCAILEFYHKDIDLLSQLFYQQEDSLTKRHFNQTSKVLVLNITYLGKDIPMDLKRHPNRVIFPLVFLETVQRMTDWL